MSTKYHPEIRCSISGVRESPVSLPQSTNDRFKLTVGRFLRELFTDLQVAWFDNSLLSLVYMDLYASPVIVTESKDGTPEKVASPLTVTLYAATPEGAVIGGFYGFSDARTLCPQTIKLARLARVCLHFWHAGRCWLGPGEQLNLPPVSSPRPYFSPFKFKIDNRKAHRHTDAAFMPRSLGLPNSSMVLLDLSPNGVGNPAKKLSASQ